MAGETLQKAKIKVYREPLEEISCLFNPAEYKISESAGYSKQKDIRQTDSQEQYTGGYQSSLSLTLYYDITENLGGVSDETAGVTSVKDYTSKIAGLLLVDGDLHRAPQIEFIWGDLAYKGVLATLNQEFTYFGIDGRPLRAKLDLSITGVGSDLAGRESPLSSPDRTKQRQVTMGTTLWKLAWDEYGDCEKWKEIARYNHLENPLDLKLGQVLQLPAWKDE